MPLTQQQKTDLANDPQIKEASKDFLINMSETNFPFAYAGNNFLYQTSVTLIEALEKHGFEIAKVRDHADTIE